MSKVKKPMIYESRKPSKNDTGQYNVDPYDNYYSGESDKDDYGAQDNYYDQEEEEEEKDQTLTKLLILPKEAKNVQKYEPPQRIITLE